MSLWDDSTIARFAQKAETTLAETHNLIVDRISLAIVAGTSEYAIPEYVTNIRRVTYQGKTLNFDSAKFEYDLGYTPISDPYVYFESFSSQRSIRFFPTPGSSIAQVTNDLWLRASIRAGVIVEFYRTPDFTGTSLRIPECIRRIFVKDIVLTNCYLREGKGQSLKLAKYFQDKTKIFNNFLTELVTLLNSAKKRQLIPQFSRSGRVPYPRLPANFGTKVD